MAELGFELALHCYIERRLTFVCIIRHIYIKTIITLNINVFAWQKLNNVANYKK